MCEGERAEKEVRGRVCSSVSSRDCDKWLSMTLTMKERFSTAWEEEKEREVGETWKEMRERSSKRVVLPVCRTGCNGLESDTFKPRARFC